MYKSVLSNRIKLSQTAISLIFATIIAIICNYFLLAHKFSIGLEGNKIAILFLEIALNYFVVFALLYLSSFNKIILGILIAALLSLSLIAAYSFNEFSILITQIVIANTLDNIGNFNDIITAKAIILYGTFFIALPLILLSKITIIKDKNRRAVFIFSGIILLIFVAILSSLKHQNRKGVIFAYPPFGLLKSYINYRSDIYTSLKNKPPLLPINDIVKTKISSQKIKNLKVVLIIGESARSKNFSINGYQTDTTPRIKKINNFLSFKDVAPCSNLTIYSVDCMLSHKTAKDFHLPANEESIIKVFEKLKFSTAYFSTQKAVGDDNGLIMLASQAQQYHFGDSIANKIGGNMVYDEYLLDDLKLDLARDGDSFIILHTQGSHFLFDDRYTDDFKIFTPICGNKNLEKCTQQQVINSYDNSIAYTDFFIDSVVNELKKQNALLIYISDHGQFLGENKIYYHGPSDSIEGPNHKVPMFLWMSDKLIADSFYRRKFNNAKKEINKKLSHDNLFDSLLDCAGIEIDSRNLSVCKSKNADKIISF